MKIVRTHQLSPARLAAVTELIECCARADRTAFTYPAGETGCHYLLFTATQQLAGLYIVLNPAGPEEAECLAFTRPDWRQKGCFRRLLDACVNDFPDTDLIFPVNHSVPAALKVMAALEADCINTSYQMELSPDDAVRVLPDTEESASASIPGLVLTAESESVLTLIRGTVVLGSCQLQYYHSSACLHHVEILPEYRRQGYAAGMLKLLIPILKSREVTRLFLHVQADNQAAVSLYQKTGFRITETLSYYLF